MDKKEIIKRYLGLNPKALEIALARHALMSWMEVKKAEGYSLEHCYREAAQMLWHGKRFGESTIERYWRSYRAEGFDGLLPEGRSDAGTTRALTEDFKKTLTEWRRKKPMQSVRELIRQLEREGVIERVAAASMGSIYRYLRNAGLDQKTLGLQSTNGPTKAFELEHVNELWMCDIMYGPVLRTQDGEKIATRLVGIIDDASRLVPHAQYRALEREEDLWSVLLEAMERRGVPQKLYTDNGKIFKSLGTRAACARLGIKLCHAKPYAAWSKGKIERLFKTVQDQFQSRLQQNPVMDLNQLNLQFWKWLEGEYHQRVHSSLGKSPQERFMEDSAQVRLLDRETLESCFWKEKPRRVRRDGTVQWKGENWEVPIFLRGNKVILRYNPLKPQDPVEVWHERKLCGTLTKLDLNLNARTYNDRQNYE